VTNQPALGEEGRQRLGQTRVAGHRSPVTEPDNFDPHRLLPRAVLVSGLDGSADWSDALGVDRFSDRTGHTLDLLRSKVWMHRQR
jgi:hypothetical protein